jgi:hypothetical protein
MSETLLPGFESKHEQKFREFHAANPEVYQQLRALALQLHRRGRPRYGIGALVEVLRWNRAIQTTDEDYKINHNYKAFYARLLMKQEPELAGFFETRVSDADDMKE